MLLPGISASSLPTCARVGLACRFPC